MKGKIMLPVMPVRVMTGRPPQNVVCKAEVETEDEVPAEPVPVLEDVAAMATAAAPAAAAAPATTSGTAPEREYETLGPGF